MPKNPKAADIPRLDHPLRKLILLLLIASVSGMAIALLYQSIPLFEYRDRLILAAMMQGFISGFGSRIILKKSSGGLRFMSAVSSLAIGLFFLGLVSEWKYGIGPLLPGSGNTDWKGLLQLSLGALASVLSLNAWRKPSPVAAAEVQRQAASRRRAVRAKIKGQEKRSTRRREKSRFHSPQTHRGQTRVKSGSGRIKPSRRTGHRKRKVQLAAGEEHRCPYCLELVRPNDRRGIVECQVCHTLHHADCWAITGTCQVPHSNA